MTKVSICLVDYEESKDLAISRDCANSQTYSNTETVVVVNPDKFLAEARNKAVDQADGDLIVILDSDAYLQPDAIEEMVRTYEEKDAKLLAGHLEPYNYDLNCPELRWLIGCTYDGYDGQNALGAFFAVDSEAFHQVGGFDESLGFKDGSGIQGEDADLSNRIRGQFGEDCVEYVDDAIAYHRVSLDEIKPENCWSRAYWQGRTKAILKDRDYGLETESSYLRHILFKQLTNPERPGLVAEVIASVGIGYTIGRLNSYLP